MDEALHATDGGSDQTPAVEAEEFRIAILMPISHSSISSQSALGHPETIWLRPAYSRFTSNCGPV
jgi:hypothetical protein